MPEQAITSYLLGQGILGMLCLVFGYVIYSLYKRNQAITEEYQKKLDELSERYVTKSETWAEKNRELASQSTAVLDALLRRKGD